MLKVLKPEDLLTVAPTTIKKFAGKGNMNKSQVFEAFVANSIDDKSLLKSPFYARIKELDCGKKVPKPVDDLVDAFFLAAMISAPALT